jgi:hypothetical protein
MSVKTLPLSAEDTQKLLNGNAKRVLKLLGVRCFLPFRNSVWRRSRQRRDQSLAEASGRSNNGVRANNAQHRCWPREFLAFKVTAQVTPVDRDH